MDKNFKNKKKEKSIFKNKRKLGAVKKNNDFSVSLKNVQKMKIEEVRKLSKRVAKKQQLVEHLREKVTSSGNEKNENSILKDYIAEHKKESASKKESIEEARQIKNSSVEEQVSEEAKKTENSSIEKQISTEALPVEKEATGNTRIEEVFQVQDKKGVNKVLVVCTLILLIAGGSYTTYSFYYDGAKPKSAKTKTTTSSLTVSKSKQAKIEREISGRVNQFLDIKETPSVENLAKAQELIATIKNSKLKKSLTKKADDYQKRISEYEESRKKAAAADEAKRLKEAEEGSQSASTMTSGSYSAKVKAGQREITLIPYGDVSTMQDTKNPAWAWNPGIYDFIINKCVARGYIKPGNFYLEPLNIINGNGYYNLFSAEGIYLVSINAKTGWMMGNGHGRQDNLDYNPKTARFGG